MSRRVFEVSELGETVQNIFDEVEAKDMKLQTMPGLIEDSMKLQNQVSERREATFENRKYAAFMDGLRKEF